MFHFLVTMATKERQQINKIERYLDLSDEMHNNKES